MDREEPFPDRILDSIGGGFCFGTVTGSVVYSLKGMYNSPKGLGERLIGGSQAVIMKAPRIGSRCAVWSGLYSCFEGGMMYIRQKSDSLNTIIAAGATSGLLSMRQGLRPAANWALVSASLFGLIEGFGIMCERERNRVESAKQQD